MVWRLSYATSGQASVRSERPLLHLDERAGPSAWLPDAYLVLEDERIVRSRGRRLEEKPLITLEADRRTLPGRTVHAHVCNTLEPETTLMIEIGVIQELAPVDEIAANIPDRPLNLTLRLCTVRPARTRCEAPVIREAQELGVSDERPAFESQIVMTVFI